MCWQALRGKKLMRQVVRPLAGIFLLFTILTSATGFLFPFNGVTPGIIIGALSGYGMDADKDMTILQLGGGPEIAAALETVG